MQAVQTEEAEEDNFVTNINNVTDNKSRCEPDRMICSARFLILIG